MSNKRLFPTYTIQGSQTGRIQTDRPNCIERARGVTNAVIQGQNPPIKTIEQLWKEAEWLINSKNVYLVNVESGKEIKNLDELREAIKDEVEMPKTVTPCGKVYDQGYCKGCVNIEICKEV